VITAIPCLADRWSGNAESDSCRDEGEDFFHFVELTVQGRSTHGFADYSGLLELFSISYDAMDRRLDRVAIRS
jgi:hypothetical protein